MKKMLFLFAAALMMVACNNDELPINDEVQYVSELKVNFGSGDTRVAANHSTAGLSFAWGDGDEIRVYENAKADAVTFYYTYDASSSSFKPKNESYKMVEGKQYFAVRGQRNTSVPLSVEDGKTIVKMCVEQDGKGLPGIPMITNVFTATAEGTIATMHHLVGVIEIPVKKGASFNKTVTGFKIYVSGSKIGYDFTATPESPYVKSTAEGYDTAWSEEKTEYVLSESEATSIFIPALPGTYENPSLTYLYSTGSYTKSISGTVTVERGKITKLSEVTFD